MDHTNFKPVSVSKGDLLFGPADVAPLMIPYDEVPKEHKGFNSKTWGHRLFCDWFYSGVDNLILLPKEGIDPEQATGHICSIMRSWQPKHEHKEACCAYLFELWFENGTWDKRKRED
jgi:hypothetical protein